MVILTEFLSEIISQWGALGLVIIGVGYLIYNDVRFKHEKRNSGSDIDKVIDEIIEKMEVNSDKINKIKSAIANQPSDIVEAISKYEKAKAVEHTQKIKETFDATELHMTLEESRKNIGCEHLVFGKFHNGTESLSTGIPFVKFDIVIDKFKPTDNSAMVELSRIYKNENILTHDLLPGTLINKGYIYFDLRDENSEANAELQYLDEVLYRRIVGRGIKQLAIDLLFDDNEVPIGFIGCIDYSGEGEFDFVAMEKSSNEIEKLMTKK